MAYVNNGDERSLKISVYKKVGGNYIQGYPKVYDGQESWGNATYPTLTDIEVRQLSSAAFNLRYNAFAAYVSTLEPGINFNEDIVGDGAIRTNTGVCLPTTTTTAAPVWAFDVKYGSAPYSACDGSITKAYANKQFPGIGDLLYEDNTLTQPWTKGERVVFSSPAIYGTVTVLVDIVGFGITEIGEIFNTAAEDCAEVPEYYSVFAYYAEDGDDICGSNPDGTSFDQIYTNVYGGGLVNNRSYYNADGTTLTDPHANNYYSTSLGTGSSIGYFGAGGTWTLSSECGTTPTPSPILPTVTTTSKILAITTSGFLAGGEVVSEGDASVTERGICWGTSSTPEVGGASLPNGAGLGVFTVAVTNALPNTYYYVRAYAISSVGTSYGASVGVETVDSPKYYSLYKCISNGITYYTGPVASGTYSTGDRVEGATGTYYIITSSQDTPPTGTNIEVTGTGLMGCPV